MGKVINTTNIEDTEYLLSQTPPNHIIQNYYLKEMQDKVDADWKYRPNRKWIEQEEEPGTEKYEPVEVVIQTVHGEKGEKVSDDWYKIVFKNCLQHNRLGKRYRFSYVFDPYERDVDKNIWIGLNQTSLTPTSSQVICRCNGSIGSIYTDENGKNIIHYEPVIQPSKLDAAMFQFSEVAIDPRGHMTIIAQHNKYTAQYYINQRFIIGYDKVYKVNNIIKADSLTTFNPMDVGIIRIYLDQDQIGEQDNFETRIAYNGVKEDPIVPIVTDKYRLEIVQPINLPNNLTEEGIILQPQVVLGDVPQSIEVEVNCELSGPYAQYGILSDYVSFEKQGFNMYTIKRLKENLAMSVKVICTAVVDGEEMELAFEMHLKDF